MHTTFEEEYELDHLRRASVSDADIVEWALLPWLSFLVGIQFSSFDRLDRLSPDALAPIFPFLFRESQYLLRLPRAHMVVTAHGDLKIAYSMLDGREPTRLVGPSLRASTPTPASRTVAMRISHAIGSLGPDYLSDRRAQRRWQAWIHRRAAQLAAELSWYRRQDWDDVEVFVTAQTVLGPARILIAVMEERGVPIVHIAETQVTSWVKDLPAGYVGLRGRREAEYYEREHGVPASRIAVVGNPTTDMLRLPMPTINPGSPGVLALSNYSDELIESAIRSVIRVGVKELIVAPHPSSDRTRIAAQLPQGWTLNERGSTLDLLMTGPSYLLHSSSGVAWEAAALGIPVADIGAAPDGVIGQYPFLEDPDLSVPADDARTLREFLDPERLVGIDRNRLRNAAMRWCDSDGDESRARIRGLIEEARLGGPRTMLLDGWRSGGPAWSASALTQLWR